MIKELDMRQALAEEVPSDPGISGSFGIHDDQKSARRLSCLRQKMTRMFWLLRMHRRIYGTDGLYH